MKAGSIDATQWDLWHQGGNIASIFFSIHFDEGIPMKNKLFALMILVLFLLSLSGCLGVIPKLEVALKLSPNEAWDFDVAFHIPQSIYALSEADFRNGLSSSQQDAEASGYQVDWQISDVNEEGNVVIQVTFTGEGYQTLNTEILDSTTITISEENGDQILNFNLSTYSSQFGEMFLMANESSFLLEGGEILSTNGTQLDKNTVVWNNPGGVLSARMKFPTANATAIILIIAGIFLIVLAAYKLVQNHSAARVPAERSAPKPIEGSPSPPTQDTDVKRFCIHCGNELPIGAKFCIKCGSKQS